MRMSKATRCHTLILGALVGGCGVLGGGGEGYVGAYFTFPSSGVNIDFGVYASGGGGLGFNVGLGGAIGGILGDSNTISGITYNSNGGVAPVGGTVMFNQDGLPIGAVAGPAARSGLSGTYARTSVFGLSDIGRWLGGWLYDKLNGCQ